MKRALVVIALVVPLAFVARQGAAPTPPVVTPRVTELGTVYDTTTNFSMSPIVAVLSPRANLVAYSVDDGVRIWNPGTRSSHALASARNGFNPSWSPEGDAIAFLRPDEQGSGSFLWTQRVNSTTGEVIGSAQRVSLSATASGFAPEFSPDGRQISFVRRDQGRSSLVVVPTSGGTERVLASGFRLTRLQWKPNGSLYYVAADSLWLRPRAFRVPAAGGTPQLVFENSADEAFPLIMKDGLLGFNHELGPNVIRMADSTGRPVATLAVPPNTWLSDFSAEYRVAAIREEHPRGLRVTDLSNGNTRTLIDTTSEAGPPTWFEDGKKLAVLARNRNAFKLVTMNPDGSGQRQFPLDVEPYTTRRLLGYMQADLSISPDGRYASFIGEQRVSLELVDLSTGRTKTLVRAQVGVGTPFWSGDSRSIRYVRDGGFNVPNATRALHEVSIDGVDKRIRSLPFSEFPGGAIPLLAFNTLVAFAPQIAQSDYKLVPIDGSPPRVLVQGRTWGGAVSPDGQRIAVRIGVTTGSQPQRQISIVSVANGERTEVTAPLPIHSASFQQFHPDGRHLFVAGRESSTGPVVFYSIPLDGSAPREVARTQTRDAISLFAVSPDARYIAYTVGATPRFSFVALDYTEGVSRLTSGSRNR